MSTNVRPLEAREWRTFRDLRVRALQESPDAFLGTIEETLDLTDDEWIEIVESTALHPEGELLVLEVDGAAMGTAFVSIRDEGEIGRIGAMWVDPGVRGRGGGRALLDAAVEWSRSHEAKRAQLCVTGGNSPAESLYRSAGFEPTGGTEPLGEGSPLEAMTMEMPL